jgi:hypothetical protein
MPGGQFLRQGRQASPFGFRHESHGAFSLLEGSRCSLYFDTSVIPFPERKSNAYGGSPLQEALALHSSAYPLAKARAFYQPHVRKRHTGHRSRLMGSERAPSYTNKLRLCSSGDLTDMLARALLQHGNNRGRYSGRIIAFDTDTHAFEAARRRARAAWMPVLTSLLETFGTPYTEGTGVSC